MTSGSHAWLVVDAEGWAFVCRTNKMARKINETLKSVVNGGLSIRLFLREHEDLLLCIPTSRLKMFLGEHVDLTPMKITKVWVQIT